MRIGVWLLGLSMLGAQELPLPPGTSPASPQPEVKPEDQCSVEGVVLNSRTRAAVAKAQVRLMRLDGLAAASTATTTDAAGRFKLAGVRPGEYQALASRSGFVRQVFGSGNAPPSLTLASGQTLTGVVLELSPAAVIAGRVVDEDGEPLADVRIHAFRYVNSGGSPQIVPVGRSVSTDDQGGYRLFDLDRGRYYVSAAYSPRTGSASQGIPAGMGNETVALAFYPGGVDLRQAIPIQLHAGDERRGVDFRLTAPHTIRIRGRLAPAPERPQEAALALAPLGGGAVATFAAGPPPSVRIDSIGAFEFRGVTAGSYLLTGVWSRDGNTLMGRLLVDAPEDTDGLELALKPAVELIGHARLDGDSQVNPDLAKLTVTLAPAQTQSGLSGSHSSGLDAGGFFKLPNVFEGDYLIRIGPPGEDLYLKTVKYGGADASGKPLSVGAAPGPLELILGVDGGQVQGVVTDGGKPAAGALVIAVPDSGREDLAKAGRAGPSGRFSLRGLAPGDYTLYAFDEVPDGSSADPDGVKAYRDKGERITLGQKSQTTADLTLIRTGNE
jgi:hypothetical protein